MSYEAEEGAIYYVTVHMSGGVQVDFKSEYLYLEQDTKDTFTHIGCSPAGFGCRLAGVNLPHVLAVTVEKVGGVS